MFFVLVVAACSGGGSSTDSGADSENTGAESETGAPSGPATMLLTFDLDADLVPEMDEPAVGTFLGSVYAEGDASAVGYNVGATALLDFTSDALDFGAAGGVSAVAATLEVDSQVLWVLGCFDSDANDCDCHDPITFPNENKFEIVPGENSITITLSLLNPQC